MPIAWRGRLPHDVALQDGIALRRAQIVQQVVKLRYLLLPREGGHILTAQLTYYVFDDSCAGATAGGEGSPCPQHKHIGRLRRVSADVHQTGQSFYLLWNSGGFGPFFLLFCRQFSLSPRFFLTPLSGQRFPILLT